MFLFGFNQEEARDAHLFTYLFGRPVGLWYPTQNYSWPGLPNLYTSEHRPPSRVGNLVLVFYFFLRHSRHDSKMTKSLDTVSKDDTPWPTLGLLVACRGGIFFFCPLYSQGHPHYRQLHCHQCIRELFQGSHCTLQMNPKVICFKYEFHRFCSDKEE